MKKQNNEKETGRRYKLGNILQSKEENKAMTLPQKVEAIACYVLESKGCLNSAQTESAKDYESNERVLSILWRVGDCLTNQRY